MTQIARIGLWEKVATFPRQLIREIRAIRFIRDSGQIRRFEQKSPKTPRIQNSELTRFFIRAK